MNKRAERAMSGMPTRRMGYNGERYLPEPVYFDAMSEPEQLRAACSTASRVAQWATSYQAWPVTDRLTIRFGPLPRMPARRAATIQDAFDWVRAILSERGLPGQWIGIALQWARR